MTFMIIEREMMWALITEVVEPVAQVITTIEMAVMQSEGEVEGIRQALIGISFTFCLIY